MFLIPLQGTLREVYHPDEAAIAALSEEFGAYKYIDFQEENSAISAVNSSSIFNVILVFAVTIAILVQP